MGQLIVLADHLADRSRPTPDGRPAFFFDLGCPFSYLASEQVERVLGDVEWIPVASRPRAVETVAQEAERLAGVLRLPLVWPETASLAFPRATRAAAYAATVGRCGAFALAAGRLAFCGGFDLDDPEILADAAGAAAIAPGDVLAAAGDPRWDVVPQATAEGLSRRGAGRLPAVRVGMAWRDGPHAIPEAATLARARELARSASARV